ncbi:MAG: molybdopterin-dependent oxidoreductase [Pseudomonadota bacterium]
MERVWSVCGMCTVRCPIEVQVENGEAVWLEGSGPAGLGGSICPRGAAGLALLRDHERPHQPLIRVGARGEGKWRPASWDEALDYTASRLREIMDREGGPRTVLFSDRGGPFVDLHQAFMRGLGSPNYCNHDASCARNTHHAAQSVFGFGRKGVSHDLRNAKHVVLQTRNMFEAINVKECKDLTAALDDGAKLTVIDVRATITASKAHNFFLVRPGTDYAFNLAVINVLIREKLYDQAFVGMFVKDFEWLGSFVEPFTPEFAAAETGVSAGRIRDLAHQLAQAAPGVVWHPGWNTARYKDSFYVARTAYIINALLGSVGAKGGLPLVAKAEDVGRKGLNNLVNLFPKPEEKRADGVGWRLPHLDAGPGLLNRALQALETADPYPIKAYLCFRHDPLMAFPDSGHLKQLLDKLDLLVSVTFTWSDTAWYSDVVLPLSVYLERESIIAHKAGLKPQFFVRRRAVAPRYDTKAEWEIFAGLARRLGLKDLDFNSIEEIWDYQLKGTGVTRADFDQKGLVSLTDVPQYRTPDRIKFSTPSGKIEIINEKWEKQGLPSLAPYKSPEKPEPGRFRLTFGRAATHTQGHTVNNPMLSEIMSENELWINDRAAAGLGIKNGDWVEVGSPSHSGRVKAKVLEAIHPECVFLVHGFGHSLPVESRALGRGLADHELMSRGLEQSDPAGGALALQEHFVTVNKTSV